MPDWLSDLREEKKRALHKSSTLTALDPASQRAAAELEAGQREIAHLVQATQVEAALNQLIEEVIRGHPWFPDASLNRMVTSRQVGSHAEFREPTPWSGAVKNHPLPEKLDLNNGRCITRIEWSVGLSYRAPQRHSLQALWIPVLVSADSVRVSGEKIASATTEAMQAAIKKAFEQVVHGAQTQHHSSHRRYQRWYKRLWNRLNYKGLATRVLIVLALIGVAVLIGWLSMRAGDFLPNRPRRMVEMNLPAVVYESNLGI